MATTKRPSYDALTRDQRRRIAGVAREHGARQVRLFGSLARGEGEASSDLDLLVELEPGRSLLDLVALKQDLEDLLDRPVDVITERAISPYMREDILRDARPL